MESAAVMKRASCSVALLLLTLCTSSVALATPLLPLNSDAYQYPTWSGTVSFFDAAGGRQLSGTIDYAVFLSPQFNADYPAYPQDGPVVYAYQIFVDNTTVLSDISHLSLAFITDPSVNPSSMHSVPSPITATPLPGTAPTSANADTEAADWFFDNTIQPGAYSQILVYSSPYLPTWSGWSVNDGGLSYSQSGWTNQLPVPGSTPAPEPATITLLCMAGLFGVPMMYRRLRRR